MKMVHCNNADLYFPESANLPGLTVQTFGHELPPPGYDTGNMIRPIWVLHYVVSGKGVFRGETFAAPCGFLMIPGEAQRITVDLDSPPFEHYWVEFSGESVPGLLLAAGYENRSNIFSEPSYYRFFDSFAGITSPSTAAFNNADLAAVSVFFELLSLHTPKAGLQKNQPQETQYAARIRKYIHDHYQEQITVSDIAASAHISVKYAGKVFKKAYGTTPVHYLNQYRMQCAQTILLRQSIPISELGKLVGVPDPSYFCKLFRSFSGGLSPSQFVRKQ